MFVLSSISHLRSTAFSTSQRGVTCSVAYKDTIVADNSLEDRNTVRSNRYRVIDTFENIARWKHIFYNYIIIDFNPVSVLFYIEGVHCCLIIARR